MPTDNKRSADDSRSRSIHSPGARKREARHRNRNSRRAKAEKQKTAPTGRPRRTKHGGESGAEEQITCGAETAAVVSSGMKSPLAAVIASPGAKADLAIAEAMKRNRRRNRVRLGQALRKKGIDEHMVAGTYAAVVDMLKGKTLKNDSVEKLLVDILKECSKHLEEDNKAAENMSVRVRLIHNVARPKRDPAPLPALPAQAYPVAESAEPDDAVPEPQADYDDEL